MGRVLVTPPAEEPLTVLEGKLHLRIDDDQTEEDGLVASLIQAARAQAEKETARAFVTQTWRLYLDAFPREFYRDAEITVPLPPLQSVTHVKYLDDAGVLQTLVANTDYIVDTKSEPGRICPAYSKSWPSTRWQANAVEVEFVCGYGLASDVPPALRAAIKLIVGTLYEYREGIVVGTSAQPLPQAVDFLLAPHRLLAVA